MRDIAIAPNMIQSRCVALSFRFTLSFGHEELLGSKRALPVSVETVRNGVINFGQGMPVKSGRTVART